MVIGGLAAEAILIIFMEAGPIEKWLSASFTVAIAIGCWLEWIGDHELDAARELRIAELSAETATANARAGEAFASAAAADERRVKLEAQIAPRRLTPEQQGKIAERLRVFGGTGTSVSVVSYLLDVEGALLNVQISESLGAAKLHVHNDAFFVPSRGVVTAVRVSGPDKKLVAELAAALSEHGIGTAISGGEYQARMLEGSTVDFKHDAAIVVVGVKPLPTTANAA